MLDEHVEKGVVGASLALIQPGRELLTLAAGRADRATGAPLTPDHLFRTASTRKIWTAVAVLALVREGRLDLDRTVEGWFPRLPRAGEIRIRHLLSHRSGLPEYEASMPKGAADDWTAQRIVEFALAGGTQNAPGETFVYSNTGYVLAGEIVAAERGEPLSRWLRRAVFAPAGMGETWCGGDEAFPRERLARAYVFDSESAEAPPEESTAWFPLSGIGAAGDLVTTPRDLARGTHALFTGQVLDRAGLDLLTTPCCRRGFREPPSPTAATASWSRASATSRSRAISASCAATSPWPAITRRAGSAPCSARTRRRAIWRRSAPPASMPPSPSCSAWQARDPARPRAGTGRGERPAAPRSGM